MIACEHGWKIGQPITLRNPEDPKLALTFIPIVEFPTEHLPRRSCSIAGCWTTR